MVLRHRKPKMASEQPVKKKLRRADDTEDADEPDYIHSLAENGMRNELSALHLSLPANVNEADIGRNTVNAHLHNVILDAKQFFRTGEHGVIERTVNSSRSQNVLNCVSDGTLENEMCSSRSRTVHLSHSTASDKAPMIPYTTSSEKVFIEPAPNIETDLNITNYVQTTIATNLSASYSEGSTSSVTGSCDSVINSTSVNSAYLPISQLEESNSSYNSSSVSIKSNYVCHTADRLQNHTNFSQKDTQAFKNNQIALEHHQTHSCVPTEITNYLQEYPGELYRVLNHIQGHCEQICTAPNTDVQLKIQAESICQNEDEISFKSEIDCTLNEQEDEFSVLQKALIEQCLCTISDSSLLKTFESQVDVNGTHSVVLADWPIPKLLRFLSTFQLIFDVYLKQNNNGHICSKIVDICDFIVRNDYSIIEQIISLCLMRNNYVDYLSTRVLSSFFIIAKTSMNHEWLKAIIEYISTDNVDYIDYGRMNFALETIKRVVEWKEIEIHILEESQVSQDSAGTSRQRTDVTCCRTVHYSDAESFDTSPIKGLIIKNLESKWPNLINKIQYLILHNNNVQSQTCVLTFLSLWESTISVKANLSVIDTKPFYAHLESFVALLNNSLPPIIWKQLLSLFNEVLCYGSTLALQDMLPDDTCKLAHLIVRYVKVYRLLDSLPYRGNEGFTVHSFVGTIASAEALHAVVDKTLLQKMVLLVLKSVAITIKETRSDSSDSSVGSDDYDFYQDMQVIVLSIQDVLKKVDSFIKSSLDFHPETAFPKLLIHLFSDQDDYMIESMVCTLDITVGISYRHTVCPELVTMLNPIHSFVEFLKVVSHDPAVLLDYLVSNETCFLLYLLRFLKYIRKNWTKFESSCQTMRRLSRSDELEDTMTVLSRLRMQIERLVSKNLFPYNITPVLKLLMDCENLYEGNENS